MAKVVGNVRREAEAAAKTPAALEMLGLTTASAAITLAVSDPPPWLDSTAYILAVSGAFFAGVAELTAAVYVLSTGRPAAAVIRKMVVYGAAPLAAAAGLSAVASLLW